MGLAVFRAGSDTAATLAEEALSLLEEEDEAVGLPLPAVCLRLRASL